MDLGRLVYRSPSDDGVPSLAGPARVAAHIQVQQGNRVEVLDVQSEARKKRPHLEEESLEGKGAPPRSPDFWGLATVVQGGIAGRWVPAVRVGLEVEESQRLERDEPLEDLPVVADEVVELFSHRIERPKMLALIESC